MECSYFQLRQNMDNLSCYYNFTHSQLHLHFILLRFTHQQYSASDRLRLKTCSCLKQSCLSWLLNQCETAHKISRGGENNQNFFPFYPQSNYEVIKIFHWTGVSRSSEQEKIFVTRISHSYFPQCHFTNYWTKNKSRINKYISFKAMKQFKSVNISFGVALILCSMKYFQA